MCRKAQKPGNDSVPIADTFARQVLELRSQADEHGWIVGQVCVVAVVDVLWIINLPVHEAEEAAEDQVAVRCCKTTTNLCYNR